jgi:hypothetical protein
MPALAADLIGCRLAGRGWRPDQARPGLRRRRRRWGSSWSPRLGPAVFDGNVLAFDVAGVLEAPAEGAHTVRDRFRGCGVKEPDQRSTPERESRLTWIFWAPTTLLSALVGSERRYVHYPTGWSSKPRRECLCRRLWRFRRRKGLAIPLGHRRGRGRSRDRPARAA